MRGSWPVELERGLRRRATLVAFSGITAVGSEAVAARVEGAFLTVLLDFAVFWIAGFGEVLSATRRVPFTAGTLVWDLAADFRETGFTIGSVPETSVFLP